MTDVSVKQRKPVSWLDPLGLARTGVMAVEAALFGAFADRREVIAALSPSATAGVEPQLDYSKPDEVWFDYIADTGDGWNATYAIACLSCAERLQVLPAGASGGAPIELPCASFTILGGDEVYPTASLENYKTRLSDPFYCASSRRKRNADAETPQPHVFALPGNHDWYDGLTSFMRLFLQGDRQIGPWLTGQARTYFSIRLPHRWWIWGVDVQLKSDVDAPQVDYFQHRAQQLQPGDRVILCTPEPSWVEGAADEFQASRATQNKTHENLVLLERMIKGRGASIPLRIAGDLHHYARYEGLKDGSQLVTCGGGGAFLHSTHPLPEEVAMNLSPTYGQTFKQRCVAPSIEWCKAKRKGVFNLIAKKPRFSITVGILYALYAWILEAASRMLGPNGYAGDSLLNYFATHFECPWRGAFYVAIYSPLAALFTAVLIFGPIKYGVAMKRLGNGTFWPIVGGALHGTLHLSLALGLMWAAARVPLIGQNLIFLLVAVGIVGGVLGGLLMAAYLFFANLFYECHDEEVYSCQAIEDYKCFTRIHVSPQGVTLYPIGLVTVPKAWRTAPNVDLKRKTGCCEPIYEMTVPDGIARIFEPDPADALKPQLIEPPITLR